MDTPSVDGLKARRLTVLWVMAAWVPIYVLIHTSFLHERPFPRLYIGLMVVGWVLFFSSLIYATALTMSIRILRRQ